ncbi:transient receptor potential cation channel subfamily A member 1-like isoform X1 [Cydia splendana]|uniref:transient receptor potential cation channel subfamily A member 1-like isoform X1 n=1 Tax=Cydia splendana TaxID=1100963 RepID=UPI0028F4B347
MCTKGVFSSLFSTDVERGVPDKDATQLRPLLSRRPGQGNASGQNPSSQGNTQASQGRNTPSPGQGNRTTQGSQGNTQSPRQDSNSQASPGLGQDAGVRKRTAVVPERPVLSVVIPPPPAPESQASTPTPTPQTETATSFQKKWRRSDRRLRRLNTELLEAIETHDIEEVERLLQNGANPNATCRLGNVSACHMAALSGGDAMALLLRHGAEKHRLDKLGRTPLHLAAYAGNSRQVAIMLDFPEDMQVRVESDMSSGTEEDVKKLCQVTRQLVNVRCDLEEMHILVPKNWKDNIDHECKDIIGSLPLFQPGWTPLHVASSCGRRHCTRLLLAAGADPNIRDVMGRTPLDVAGSALYFDKEIKEDHFVDVLKMLLKAKGQFHTMRREKGVANVDTPLHTAVMLDSKEAIELLLEAGAQVSCLNSSGLTPLHLCVKKEQEIALQVLANYDYKHADPLSAVVDVKDEEGHTVLQAAIEAEWVPGVCVALEAGADVTLRANDGETPIHSAAAIGNIEVLSEILSLAKQSKFIDCQNDEGETPLFKAITNGHVACVRALLKDGAAIDKTLPGDINVLHVAADHGHLEILKCLLEYDQSYQMLNVLTAADKRGMGPIHFAVSGNHYECVKFLLEKNADIRLRTTCSPHKSSTPLHIAAAKNYSEVAKVILAMDKTTIHEVNSMGWFPLHTAAHHSSREVIALLLKDGGNLAGYTDGPKKFRRTAIDMLLNNLSKPTEYLEEVLDTYITSNTQNLQENDCIVTVDFAVLIPNVCEMEQMKVIEALLKTGNRYGQRRLLVHPLVESFLFLKWKVLLPFFYTIIAFYAFFVFSLSTFVVSVFWYKDTDKVAPEWLSPHIWGYVVYSAVFVVLIQELLYMNVKSSRYFLQLETWVKFGSIGLATLLPPAITITSWMESDWPRHVATVALLLSWLEMMFLLSRFPNWGYYVLMFGKVASNIVKILLTFVFLVIGFSLSFMIQFRSTEPFDDPWSALVKTLVMMTSEFEYEALFDDDHAKTLSTSISVVRFMFVLFLILAAIVLMNLMVGVAVNDINDLEILGNISRLAKQVEFLGTLDVLAYNRFFQTILPKRLNNHIKNRRRVMGTICLCPGKPRWRHYKLLPSKLRDAILDRAQAQEKLKEVEMDFKQFRQKMDEMHEVLMKSEKKKEVFAIEDRPVKMKQRFDEINKHLKNLDDDVGDVKDQLVEHENTQTSINELNVKMDQMSLDIENIKQFLLRLESKLSK